MATSPKRSPIYIPPLVDEFIELLDTPDSYSGQAGKLLRVKSYKEALEFLTCVFASSTLNTLERRARKTGADWDYACGVAWSPDGKYVAIVSSNADAVEVAEFTGTDLVRKARVTGADWDGARGIAWSPDGKYVAIASYDADAVEVAS